MNQDFKCFLILLALAIVTFAAGYSPTVVQNKKILNLLAIFGGGILMGAAMLVVLPESVGLLVIQNFEKMEGMGQVVTAADIFNADIAITIGLPITIGFAMMLMLDEIANYFQIQKQNGDHNSSIHKLSEASVKESDSLYDSLLKKENKSQVEQHGEHDHSHHHDEYHDHKRESSVMITTIGLCFHSLAEGVAMGASLYLGSISTGGSQGIGATVSIALFIHKIPESIAFGSYLLHMQCNVCQQAIYLMCYACASPVSGFVSFIILCFMSKGQETGAIDSYTSIAMLVSVGTFLYVVTIHILPEVYLSHHKHSHEQFDEHCEEKLEKEGFQECEGTINKACQEILIGTKSKCPSSRAIYKSKTSTQRSNNSNYLQSQDNQSNTNNNQYEGLQMDNIILKSQRSEKSIKMQKKDLQIKVDSESSSNDQDHIDDAICPTREHKLNQKDNNLNRIVATSTLIFGMFLPVGLLFIPE